VVEAVAVAAQDGLELAALVVPQAHRGDELHVADLDRPALRREAAERGARHLQVGGAGHHRMPGQPVLVQDPVLAGAQPADEDLRPRAVHPLRGEERVGERPEIGDRLLRRLLPGLPGMVRRGHAHALPGVPVDRDDRLLVRAGLRKRVQKGVGGGVVGLTDTAGQTVERGAEDQEVGSVLGVLGQEPGEDLRPPHLGRQDRRRLLRSAELHQPAARQARRVDRPGDAAEAPARRVERPAHGDRVRGVGRHGGDLRPVRLKREKPPRDPRLAARALGERRPGLPLREGGPAGQDELHRRLPGEQGGELQSHSAQAAGHQVDAPFFHRQLAFGGGKLERLEDPPPAVGAAIGHDRRSLRRRGRQLGGEAIEEPPLRERALARRRDVDRRAGDPRHLLRQSGRRAEQGGPHRHQLLGAGDPVHAGRDHPDVERRNGLPRRGAPFRQGPRQVEQAPEAPFLVPSALLRARRPGTPQVDDPPRRAGLLEQALVVGERAALELALGRVAEDVERRAAQALEPGQQAEGR